MNFSGEHSAQRLRYGQAPRGRRSGASGWASDPADKEPLGWAFAPPIGCFRMAVCPADRVPPRMAVCPTDRVPPRWQSAPQSDGFDTRPCPCKRKKATP